MKGQEYRYFSGIVAAGCLLLLILLTSCAQAPAITTIGEPSQETQVGESVEVEKEAVKEIVTSVPAAPAVPTQAPSASELKPLPTASPIAQATQEPAPYVTPEDVGIELLEEKRVVQLEWPDRMRLGDSDVIRLALVPSEAGYQLATEFPEHQIITQTLTVPRPGGYDLFAVARLDGVGFEISPSGDQVQFLPPAQALGWRWTLSPMSPGQQRLSITLTLRWIPVSGPNRATRDITVYSLPLNVQVITFFGLTQSQALATGFIGLFIGGGLSLVTFFMRPAGRKSSSIRVLSPNPRLEIELSTGLRITQQEQALLQSMFGHYARLVIEQEFLSGYSGARTFLALPIRQDGRADAVTIAKLGEQETIKAEFTNYENYVKHTLPPITARIQHTPVTTTAPDKQRGIRLAALQYTFIGKPGSTPTSLHQALLDNPDPNLLRKLFDTFGPSWWLQRRPYTFRLAQEYDRLLPTHLVLEPSPGKRPAKVIDLRSAPAELHVEIGEIVTLRGVSRIERRTDGQSLSLTGVSGSGIPSVRVRWLGPDRHEGAIGQVVATRRTLLKEYVQDCDLLGLPDPIQNLPNLLSERLSGSQSTIHGDLNLENILIGPGEMLWLIDFAQTRDGHTLLDFAHLYAELVAHILAPQIPKPADFLAALRNPGESSHSRLYRLLNTVEEIARRCLFNPSHEREWQLSLGLTCLGTLKYKNLTPHARHLLYLTGAYNLYSQASSTPYRMRYTTSGIQ